MEHTKDLSINLELSLDGSDYYCIDELNITEKEMIEKAMTLFIAQLRRLDSMQQHSDLTSENHLYLRLKHSSSENYNDHLIKQKKLYESLTRKEKTILCFIGRGHQQKQISFVLGITPNTFRQHQKNIYRKMNFHNKVQMAVWCEKYLRRFFNRCS